MKKIYYVVIFLGVFCNFVFAQQKSNIQNLPKTNTNEGISQSVSKISLIVSKCKSGEGVCRIKEIFKYNFSGGEFVSTEKILESENLPSGLEASVIYKNRYIITEFADVIDIEKGQIIHNGTGFLFEIKNNLVFEIVEEWWAKVVKTKKTGVFSFDLNTGIIKKIEANKIWKYRGEWSPDRTKSVSYEPNKGLQIYSDGQGRKVLNVKLGVNEPVMYCCCRPKVPLIWIDNERLLTQKQNGELVTVSLAGKVTPLGNIGKENTCGPSFGKDEEDNIIYYYGKNYLVDIKNSSIVPLIFEKKGNGFMSKLESYDEKTGLDIVGFYFNSDKIGEFEGNTIKTAKGNIAVEYKSKEPNKVYPVGIKVWNDIKKDWIIFDIDWLPTVIGWVEYP